MKNQQGELRAKLNWFSGAGSRIGNANTRMELANNAIKLKKELIAGQLYFDYRNSPDPNKNAIAEMYDMEKAFNIYASLAKLEPYFNTKNDNHGRMQFINNVFNPTIAKMAKGQLYSLRKMIESKETVLHSDVYGAFTAVTRTPIGTTDKNTREELEGALIHIVSKLKGDEKNSRFVRELEKELKTWKNKLEEYDSDFRRFTK